MSTLGNLTAYNKIIVSDLSLNGDLSFSDIFTDIIGHTGPIGDKGTPGTDAVDGPTGPTGPSGGSSSSNTWTREANGDIHYNGSVGLGAVAGKYSTDMFFRAVGEDCEMFIGKEGYMRLMDSSSVTDNYYKFGPPYGGGLIKDPANNTVPCFEHFFHGNNSSNTGVDPKIKMTGGRTSSETNYYQGGNVGTGNPMNDWIIGCMSNGSERRLAFWWAMNANYKLKGYVSSSGSHIEMNFTGQHRTFIKDIPHKQVDNYEGLIVCANTDTYIDMKIKTKTPVYGKDAITINDSLPLLTLARKNKDVTVFGVIATAEEIDEQDGYRTYRAGNLGSSIEKEYGDKRVHINSVGEGGIWVSNKNGILESGDYITSSNIPGYGQKQDSQCIHNYTVAKITMNCDFHPSLQYKKKIKSQEINFTNIDASNNYYDLSSNDLIYTKSLSHGTNELIEEYKNFKYNLELDGSRNLIQARQNILNEYGEIQWEDTNEQEYAYNIRYVDISGNIITKNDYDNIIMQGNLAFIAAFVGCTYHCG